MTGRRPKASDLTDAEILAAYSLVLASCRREVPGISELTFDSAWREHFSNYPPKVVRAKLASMIRRGLMNGCACGCRGDYYPTEKGRTIE